MPEGQNNTCNLYVEDKNDEDIWEEPRRDTGPVYVAAEPLWNGSKLALRCKGDVEFVTRLNFQY